MRRRHRPKSKWRPPRRISRPGTITTLIVFLREATTAQDKMIYAAVVASILVMLGIVLYFAAAIGQRLSATLRVIGPAWLSVPNGLAGHSGIRP